MLHWINSLVGSLNTSGVVLLMAIENVVLPLPSELIMPPAGATVTMLTKTSGGGGLTTNTAPPAWSSVFGMTATR